MIQYLDEEGVFFKIRNFYQQYHYMWVLERIVKPALDLREDHETEEIETLFSITKNKNFFSEEELFHIIDGIYKRFQKKFKEVNVSELL